MKENRKQPKKRKTPRRLLCTFKDRRRNYLKANPLMSGRVVAARGLCGRQCCMVHSAALSDTVKNRQNLMMSDEKENSYRIARRAGRRGLQHQAGVEKLAIGTGTDSHGNDPELNRGNSNQIIGVGILPKETTATARQRDLLVEIKTNTFNGLKTIAKKVIKYRQVKNLALHQQMKTTYFVKYEKEENVVQALMELTKEGEVGKLLQ